ncbi:hypothetical protein SDC9_174967 [bioreactor metagenome]|uniref:Uncharacterized protein n=1 Tax=bioreactor metagenome TaxID=1076179 RepID=A0A645GV62_9ZZZZ
MKANPIGAFYVRHPLNQFGELHLFIPVEPVISEVLRDKLKFPDAL